MNLNITPRDRALFKYLYENKVATRVQIARDLFGKVTRQTICRRLKKLSLQNYIEFRSSILNDRSIHIYSITQKGVEVIKNEYRHLITEKIKKSDSQNHDLDLVDIRYVIEKFTIAKNYFTENMLTSCSEFAKSENFRQFVDLRSDGVLEIDTPDGSFLVAIEYDINHKAMERYRSKLMDYYFSNQIKALLYICSNMTTLKLLKRVDGEVCKEGFKPKIFYTLKENVQKDAKELLFKNIKGDIFTLR